MQSLGRADIVNAGSGEPGYSECGVSWRADIVNAGSGRPDIVNAGSWESRYSECRVRGEQI
ncbi:unnamed protein product [Staurois parvus]|uniref:Uncharacterized protein n=1 Tax=Staurois parvus TaxID=386267 RepID=A0ABN9BRC2_9NEOB|nr:unnamed protein product [Staurois parvus]